MSQITWETQQDWEDAQKTDIDVDGTIFRLAPQIPAAVDHRYPMDEGSGSTVFDNEGSIDGTITGATWQNDDVAVGDHYLQFDGDNDYIDLGVDPFPFLYSSDWTITAFVIDDGTDADRVFFGQRDSSTANGINLNSNSGTLRATFGGIDNIASSHTLTQGQRHFVSYRYDRSVPEITIGLDGSYQTLSAPTPNTSTNNAWIGGLIPTNEWWLGGIDEMTFSDALLTDSDLDVLQSREGDA